MTYHHVKVLAPRMNVANRLNAPSPRKKLKGASKLHRFHLGRKLSPRAMILTDMTVSFVAQDL